jgi:intraflagellar transport protein 80
VALRDRSNHAIIELFETKTGKVAGDGRISHNVSCTLFLIAISFQTDVVELAINQCGPVADRRVAFVDANGECFIGLVNTYGAARRWEKIGEI